MTSAPLSSLLSLYFPSPTSLSLLWIVSMGLLLTITQTDSESKARLTWFLLDNAASFGTKGFVEFQIIQQLTLFCLARIGGGGEEREKEAQNWSGKSQETSMKGVVGQERKAGSLNSGYFCSWVNNCHIIKQPLALWRPPSVIFGLRKDNRAQSDTLLDKLPSMFVLQLAERKRDSEENKPVTFVFWTGVCLCLWPLCCDVCELLSGTREKGEVCHLCPSPEVFNASEALQKPTERRR